jgi:hypothetical protein
MVELRDPTSSNETSDNTVKVCYAKTCRHEKTDVIMNKSYKELKTCKYINC